MKSCGEGTSGRSGGDEYTVSPVNQASHMVVLGWGGKGEGQGNVKCFHPLNEEDFHLGVESAQGAEE